MESQPKILVACPTYKGMKYCLEPLLESLRNLRYSNYDILLLDNSEGKEFYKYLSAQTGIKTERLIAPNTNALKKIVRSRNKIITYALEKDYDYVFMVDGDVIVPEDILQRLLSSRKDIISGIYFNIFTINGKNVERPVAWKKVEGAEYEKVKPHIKDIELVESQGGIRRHLTPNEYKSGDILSVYVPSAGCMLIARNVLESGVRYGILDVPDGLSTSDDIYFCKQAHEKGYRIYCDTSLTCKHLIEGKFRFDGKSFIHPAYEK